MCRTKKSNQLETFDLENCGTDYFHTDFRFRRRGWMARTDLKQDVPLLKKIIWNLEPKSKLPLNSLVKLSIVKDI